MERLKIKNLCLELDNKKILKDVNIFLENENKLVIIGESGAGKSIFSKLFVGIKPNNSLLKGEINIFEKNILEMCEEEWNEYRGKKIAYISQNPMAVFNDYQNIESHIVELYKSHFDISGEEAVKIVVNAMEKLEFKNPYEIIKKYPFQLSGGMLQRIMFVMMLELNPDLLIVDEPTSALDYENSERIIKILKNYEEKNKLLIVITHDYNLAQKIGGKLVILKNGEIYKQGNLLEIFKNEKDNYIEQLLLSEKFEKYE